MNLYQLIKKPILTEKSMRLAGGKWYCFAVDNKATKKNISSAVEEIYGVDVQGVRTLKMKGKTRRFGKMRREQQLSGWKKAFVKIKPDQKIEIFEEEEKK